MVSPRTQPENLKRVSNACATLFHYFRPSRVLVSFHCRGKYFGGGFKHLLTVTPAAGVVDLERSSARGRTPVVAAQNDT